MMENLLKIGLIFCISFLLFSPLKLSESAASCNENDKNALLQIKSYFRNASAFSSWNPNTDCCNWDSSVACNDASNPGRVTDLVIAAANDVVGQIPAAIAELTYLTRLQLFQLPNLRGPIPSFITKLRKLQVFSLVLNDHSGPIPDFLGQMKSLQFLDLSSNRFSGHIPSSLSLLSNLNTLNLQRNKLAGSIPKSFGSFSSNLYMLLSRNKLSGTIPPELGKAKILVLDLSENGLTGDATFLFGKDKALFGIMLRDNELEFDFSKVELSLNLRQVDISHNKIYGSLPKRLGELKLQSLDVSYNQLCGPIPTSLESFGPNSFVHNKCLCGPPLPPCN